LIIATKSSGHSASKSELPPVLNREEAKSYCSLTIFGALHHLDLLFEPLGLISSQPLAEVELMQHFEEPGSQVILLIAMYALVQKK
jgi:hypothetical protein